MSFTVRPTSPLQIHSFCDQDGNSGKTHLEPLKWVVRNQWVTSQYLRQSIKLSMSSIKVYRKAMELRTAFLSSPRGAVSSSKSWETKFEAQFVIYSPE